MPFSDIRNGRADRAAGRTAIPIKKLLPVAQFAEVVVLTNPVIELEQVFIRLWKSACNGVIRSWLKTERC